MPSEITHSSGWFALLWGTSRKRVQLLLLVIGIIAIALMLAQAQVPSVELEADVPGVGVLGQRFMIAVPITNGGTVNAMNVQVTGATLGSASLISPTTFPVVLGVIAPGERSIFQADFDDTLLAQNTMYPLMITGTYQVNEVTFSFTLTLSIGLPPPSPGSGTTQTATIPAEDLSGAPFPPRPPAFGPEVNEPGPPVPTGPFVAGTQTQQSISIQPLSVLGGAAAGDPGVSAVAINANSGFGILPANTNDFAEPREPSGASGKDVVFVSFNWAAAYTTTGASTFTLLDPTTMFPQSPYGFCCDQHVQYVPEPIDRFVWLQQLTVGGGGTPGAYRLAAASPVDIKKYNGQTKAWKSWLLTPESVGLVHKTQFDFPSMSVGNNYLYVSWNDNCPSKPPLAPHCVPGHEVIRIALSDIKSGKDPLPLRYATNQTLSGGCTPTGGSCMAWSSFLTQDTGDEVFWAGHNGTTELRVFSWAEGSDTYYWRDRGMESYVINPDGGTTGHIASLAPFPLVSETPTSPDWLYRKSDDAITGATRSGSNIFFAWGAAPSGNIAQPNIEMVALNVPAGYVKVQQGQIWSATFAVGLPSLSTNACTGDIGVSLAYGGGGNYPNHAVGFWGDATFYPTTAGNVTGSQYGDYVTIRQNYTPNLHGAFLDAFGYALTNASGGSATTLPTTQVNASIRHVVFGRPGACGR